MSIGDFARLGQVSVRMLRHYDQIGLLVPASVNAFSGYRSYSVEQLRGMLLLLHTELAVEQTSALAALGAVEHRLQLIEQENTVIETVNKSIPAVRLAAARATVAEQSEVASTIQPIFDRTAEVIVAAGHTPGTAVACYVYDDEGLHITAGFEFSGPDTVDAEIVELPAVDEAICTVHLGEMASVAASWQGLMQAASAQGLEPSEPGREVYLNIEPLEDQSQWVTEIQQPVARA